MLQLVTKMHVLLTGSVFRRFPESIWKLGFLTGSLKLITFKCPFNFQMLTLRFSWDLCGCVRLHALRICCFDNWSLRCCKIDVGLLNNNFWFGEIHVLSSFFSILFYITFSFSGAVPFTSHFAIWNVVECKNLYYYIQKAGGNLRKYNA